MTDDDTTNQTTAPRRDIVDKRKHLNNAITLAFDAENDYGDVPREIRNRLRTATLAYAEELSEHREENVVDHEWPDDEIAWLTSLSRDTVTDYEDAPGDTSASVPTEKLALHAVDWRDILKVARQLKLIGKDLGFAAEVGMKEADLDEAVV